MPLMHQKAPRNEVDMTIITLNITQRILKFECDSLVKGISFWSTEDMKSLQIIIIIIIISISVWKLYNDVCSMVCQTID